MAEVTVNETSTDPNEHYSCGYRAMVMGDYSTAVAAFGRCSELKAAALGERDDSLGETYYFYGKCLLEASREEQNELGDAIPKEEDEDDEDDGEEAAAADGDGKPEKNGTEASAGSSSASASAAAGAGDAGDANEAKTNGTTPAEPDGAVAGGSGSSSSNSKGEDNEKQEADSTAEAGGSGAEAPEDGVDGAGDDEATDLQVAWEVLELAKIIFENRGDVAKEKLADTLILLGEVSLESENFENGIQDIQQGVEIHKAVYGDDNRKLAESYYKLGMAMLTGSRYDEAAENFKNALNILRNVVSKLENSPEKNQEKVKEEIEEVKELIPEIEEKITESKTYKKEAIDALMSQIKDGGASTHPDAVGSSSSSSTKTASDITHLVKRKRKVEEGEAESLTVEQPAKKPSP